MLNKPLLTRKRPGIPGGTLRALGCVIAAALMVQAAFSSLPAPAALPASPGTAPCLVPINVCDSPGDSGGWTASHPWILAPYALAPCIPEAAAAASDVPSPLAEGASFTVVRPPRSSAG